MWWSAFFTTTETLDGGNRRRNIPATALAALLVVIGVVYYGLYFRCGFNLSDEGSVALLSKRILEGEQPFKDLMIGYNVLWFAPVTWLFKVFGVSLIVVKIYFFALAIVTALLGFGAVRKVTGCKWLAFGTGVVLVLIPGTAYRTYLPLLAVANVYFLVTVALSTLKSKASWRMVAVGAVILGLTFLVRIEIGLFCFLLWLGLIFLKSFGKGYPAYRVIWCAGNMAAVTLIVLLVHLPAYRLAKAGGYEVPFVEQYTIQLASTLHLPSWLRPLKPMKAAQLRKGNAGTRSITTDKATMPRRSPREIWEQKHWRKKTYVFLIYAPIVSLGILGLALIVKLAAGGQERAWSGLLAIGGALTVFPQFFFFRPDLGHLSEFMPGCMVALVCGTYLVVEEWQTIKLRWIAAGVAGVAMLHGVVYITYALPERYAGTIAARFGRSYRFQAENGVDVYLNKEEFSDFSEIMKVVQGWAKPQEYVVCYPYLPGINFMTNRATYERSLYVDNATRSTLWEAQAIERIKTKKPAVIIVDEWSINRSESSRFDKWAPEIQEFLNTTYHPRGAISRFKIYTRDAE